jgi:NADPH:quinone reductase-like Zn-dependent oxidoreductase
MRAIYIQKHGRIADLKLTDVPVPSIRAGEVLVRVAAARICLTLLRLRTNAHVEQRHPVLEGLEDKAD